MGGAKRLMEEQEEVRGLALGLLCELKILRECENHPGCLFDGGGNVEDAYRTANYRISNRKIELPEGYSRRDFTDILKSEYEDNSASEFCYACAKNFEDD